MIQPGIDGCCRTGQEPARMVVLSFLRSGLLYDIRNSAYVEADVMQDAGIVRDNTHARHTTADIGEEGNIDRVHRLLTMAHRELKELLYPFTKKAPEEETIYDKPEAPKAYEIELSVPQSMSRSTLDLLSSLSHEYMVARVLADWLMSTNTEAAAQWQMKAEEAKEAIERTKGRRRIAMTRKISVF